MPDTRGQPDPALDTCRPDSGICHLICVPPDRAALVWPHVRALILAAMRRGDLSGFRPVESSVLSGAALLWLAVTRENGIEAAAVTELQQTEWRRVCVVVACGAPSGGRLPSSRALGTRPWLRLLDGIEAYAKAAGCSAVRIMGRKGWARVLTSYLAKRIILEKDL
ncbi:MAG: hypothetical protein WBW74_19120 [Xanthobacteraceae bacterium]